MPKKKQEAVDNGGEPCACGCDGKAKTDAMMPGAQMEAFGVKEVDGKLVNLTAEEVKAKADDAPAIPNQPTIEKPECVEAQQDSQEILAPLAMGRVYKIPRNQIKLSPAFPIHSGQEHDQEYQNTLPPETFDVDAKMFLVWQNNEGEIILVDGHHHYKDAMAATHFVTSKFQKDRLVSCEADLLCRCIYEADGWTMDMVRVLSERANFDGKKAITLNPEEQTATDSILCEGFEVVIDCLVTDSRSFTILSRDSKKNEIKVRQRATRWDSVNENNRIYPHKVGEQARLYANAWAEQGLMTSELEHPGVVRDCQNGICEEKFAHNPKRQTAIVHKVFPADADGWVDVERTIKGNTPCGKVVMDAFLKGEPMGISTRFHVKGKEKWIDGRRILVADAMDILTFDDVENPAVLGAGSPSPVTDSILSFLTGDSATYGPAPPDSVSDSETYSGLPGRNELSSTDDPYLGTPFFGTNNNTINPPNERYGEEPLEEALEKSFDQDSLNLRHPNRAQEETNNNMYDIPRLIADFKTTYGKPGGIPLNHTADGCKIVHAIAENKAKGDAAWQTHLDSFKTAFDASTMAGYRGGAIAATVASEMGGEVGAGWGSEIETATGLNKLVHSSQMTKTAPHGEDGLRMGASPDSDAKTDTVMHPALKALVDAEEEKKAKKEMKAEFEKAAEDCEEIKDDEPMKDSLWKMFKSVARPGTDAKMFIATQLAFLGKNKGDQTALDAAAKIPANGVIGKVLSDKGTAGDQQGDTARNGSSVKHEYRPWAAGTADFLQATDDMCRKMRGAAVGIDIADPDSPETIKRRALNHKLLAPILEDHGKRRMQMAGDNRDFKLASDSKDDGRRLLQESCRALLKYDDRSVAAVDTTTTAVVLNQPSVSETQIVQGFQDLTALEFVMAMGPRGFNSTTGGFTRDSYPIGTNLRIPSIGYNNPSGWGYSDGIFDAGLTTPENAGIQPGNTTVAWLNFGITPRKISAILTWEAIKTIGNGPGDISLLSWELYMMAARESRTIDNALYNEMVAVAYEFGAVVVTAEAYSVGNNLLVNNSVYSSAGPVIVNLNPQKKATAAVVAGDMSITYPAAPPAGTQQIIGAVRLLAGGTNTNAAPFYGFYNGVGYPGTIGPGPIVRPRTTKTLSDQFGNTSNVTTNPVTVTAPAGAVLGQLTSTGGIWSYPGTTATCAIDNENGLLLFCTGVTGGGTGITTNVTLTYSYATNWADFVSDPVLAQANNLIPSGITDEQYANGLFRLVDKESAMMGSSTNYVKPDCALTNLIGSATYTYAQLFAPLFSPPATMLFPSPSAVAERSGVTFHRHNSSWVGRSQTLLLTRKGSTFYAQDTPFQLQGPVTVQDSNGNPTGNLAFYGIEFSVIGTRQPIDLSGNVLNCPNKVLILRMQSQGIGVL